MTVLDRTVFKAKVEETPISLPPEELPEKEIPHLDWSKNTYCQTCQKKYIFIFDSSDFLVILFFIFIVFILKR